MIQRASITKRVGHLLSTLSSMNLDEDSSRSSSEESGNDAFLVVKEPKHKKSGLDVRQLSDNISQKLAEAPLKVSLQYL